MLWWTFWGRSQVCVSGFSIDPKRVWPQVEETSRSHGDITICRCRDRGVDVQSIRGSEWKINLDPVQFRTRLPDQEVCACFSSAPYGWCGVWWCAVRGTHLE